MSPWSESRPRTWPLYLGIALIVLGSVIGYLLMAGVVGADNDESQDPPPSDSLPPALATPSGSGDGDPPPAVAVVSWGRASDQLAVVVRNESRRHIEHARITITARDRGGEPVLTTSGTAPDVCCTIVGLPPGEEFGLFADLDSPHVEIAAVDVEPIAIRTRRASGARVAVAKPELLRYDDDTVVTVTLTARGSRLSGYVAAQAVLADAEGVAQVISGRFYCFEPGRPHRVRLRLFHAVPGDLRLDRVLAYPIPVGVRPHVRGRCG